MHWKEAEAVFNRCSRKFYVIAMGVTGNRRLAEDAVHEAILAVVSSGASPRNLEAYLCRSVRNEAIRLAADRQRFVTDASEFLTGAADTSPAKPEEEAFVQQVGEAMDKLTSDQRETIVMHVFGGMTFREISEIRETPLSTVTSWYRRGIASLRTGVLEDG